MENGFTTQLTNRVTTNPFGFRPTFSTDAKSTFIIIGMIMSQMRMAIGALMWLPSPNSIVLKVWTTLGAHVPNATPATIQSPTQMVRYRSKRWGRLPAGATAVDVRTASILCILQNQDLLINKSQKNQQHRVLEREPFAAFFNVRINSSASSKASSLRA